MGMTKLAEMARSAGFRQYVTDLLVEICRVDTTPRADVDSLRRAESEVFDVLQRHVGEYGLSGLRCERRPVNPLIAKHPFFSQPYYTSTPETPAGLGATLTYRDRSNLLLMLDGCGQSGGGVNQAINAHIDVVRPYIPPRVEGGKVFGRGACDDKGAVVAFMAALKLVGNYLKASRKRLASHLTGMIVIEEEMGGNGSLSLAMDRELKKRYDSMMVLECCGGRIHPGNRGALWYKVEAYAAGGRLNLFEASAFIIEQMEKEGRAIKAESNHPLFPHRPVQTCHGIIGPYGEHPSRINARVDLDVVLGGKRGNAAAARQLISDVIDSAVADYVGVYGDKTKVKDDSGRPKVDHHYDLLDSPEGFTIQVHGASGHMGSILENDCAITKMATIVRALLRSRKAITAAAGGEMRLQLHGGGESGHLILEGGQGFLPTHDMPQVMQRIRQAALRGAENYLRTCPQPPDLDLAKCFVVSFDKLHNAAFAGATDSADLTNATQAAREAGIPADGPVRGWDVSCDARLFACEYPDMPVLTTGPGQLACAHGDNEHVDIEDLARSAEFLAYFILKQTRTVD